MVDSDVPWIPQINRPAADARILHIDVDPLKQQMPLWYIGAQQMFRADAATALRQINEQLDGIALDATRVRERSEPLRATACTAPDKSWIASKLARRTRSRPSS